MQKIRIGLVGCGRISVKHFEAFNEHRDSCHLISVCDVVKERVEEAARVHNAKAYYDYKEMIKVEELDLVVICTDSGSHPKIGVDVANAGINVLTEKPMAITLKEADNLISACDTNNVNLFVVKQNRLNTTMQLLKKAVKKGRFGKIYMAHINVFWQRPQSYYDVAKWRGTWEFDGGAFCNQASHYVDALQWLIGDVDSIMAMTATMARDIEAEDTGSAVIKFRNGAIGTMNVTMLTYPKNFEGSITIIGEKGTVKVGGVAINKIEKWEFSEYDDDDKLVEQASYDTQCVYGFGHTGYYDNVFDVLNGRAKPHIDGRSGRKSLELIRAIYKSAREGTRVPLPLTE